MPNLYIIAGCNGAGKTTASFTILPEILKFKEFVNADSIAARLSPFNPDLRLMRLLFPLLISFTLCLGACQSPGHSGKKDKGPSLLNANSAGHSLDSTTTLADSAINVNDSIALSKLKARFADAPILFKGLWVNEHYISEIRQGKPLREAQDSETRCIVIPARTLQVTRWIYGFHEGGEGLVVVKNGSGYFIYSIYSGLCVDTLRTLADERLRVGHDYYIHVGEEDSTSSDLGVLEQLLFAGQYLRLDATGTAAFAKNGRIEGLDSLGWYEPVIDYVGDPTSVDHIKLGRDKEHLSDYGFLFVGDTMMIYSIDCRQDADGDCVSDTLGRRMYVLPKLKQ